METAASVENSYPTCKFILFFFKVSKHLKNITKLLKYISLTMNFKKKIQPIPYLGGYSDQHFPSHFHLTS